MDKTILCLANSYKHGGRCIAGIEIEVNNGNLTIKRSTYGIPIWIRPVSHSIAGEVPLVDASGIDVFSIVKIHDVQYAGDGAHSEDYYYSCLEKLASINPSDEFLTSYTDTWHTNIFGNRGRAVTPDCFASGNYSVMLIRTEGSSIYLDNRYSPKPRIKFMHKGNEYDFPITDPEYLNKLRSNPNLYHDNYGILYIVASLGVEHDGWHSKLAATIITPATINVMEQINLPAKTRVTVRPSVTKTAISLNIGSSNGNTGNSDSYNPGIEKTTIRRTIPTQIKNPTELKRYLTAHNTTNNSGNNSSVPNRSPYNGTPHSSSSSGGCYIATSVYGSYDCPEVWTLRRFRDKKLSKTWYGMIFINIYYAISPKLVKWFGDTSWFKKLWKSPLDCLVKTLNERGGEDTPYIDRTN